MQRSITDLFVIPLIALAVLAAQPRFCRAGGVVKMDESVITGEIIECNGTTVVVESRDAANQPVTYRLDLQDVLHVRLASGAPTIAPPMRNVAPSMPVSSVPVPVNAQFVTSTSRPITLNPTWQLKLLNGDLLFGTPGAWNSQRLEFGLQQGGLVIELPTQQIAELFRASPDLVKRAKSLQIDSSAQDVAYVVKDQDILAVKGVVKGIENEALVFSFDGQDRRINLNSLLGLTMVPQKGASVADSWSQEFRQVARLYNGGVVSGRWTGLDANWVTMTASWGTTLKIPAMLVTGIDVRNGRVVYLSDVKPVKIEQTPYFDRIMPWRADMSLEGSTLKLNDGQYTHGIAVHSRCVLEYDLGKKYERFRTKIGFEQPAGAMGKAVVRVLADGKVLYENTDARGDRDPENLDLDVKGAARLVLEVDFGKEQDVGDRIIWANARLQRVGVAP